MRAWVTTTPSSSNSSTVSRYSSSGGCWVTVPIVPAPVGCPVMAPRWLWWRHPETLVCGVRGHVVPAGWAQQLRGALAPLVIITGDGRRLGQCLRCDAWLDTPIESTPAGEPGLLSPDLVPRRGQALRDAIILRAIAVER